MVKILIIRLIPSFLFLGFILYANFMPDRPPDYKCSTTPYILGEIPIKQLTISGKYINKDHQYIEVSDIYDSILIDSFRLLVKQATYIENFKACRPIDWENYDDSNVWYNDSLYLGDFWKMNGALESISIHYDQCYGSYLYCLGMAANYRMPELYPFIERIYKQGRKRQIPDKSSFIRNK